MKSDISIMLKMIKKGSHEYVVTLQGDPGSSEEMLGGAFVGIFCTYFHTVSFLLNLPLRFSL